MAQNPPHRIFITLQKVTCYRAYHNSILKDDYRARISVELSGFLYFAAHMFAMVTCYMKRMTAPCLSMIGHLYTITVASLVKQWQYSSFKKSLLEKCWN